ncbi:MAG: thiamine phosphate synthase [Kiritimatiellae bacterium]|nr:thiamine phosphate synthase [Kiritimatiellia bacterium]
MNPFSLYLVTDRTLSLGRPLVDVVRDAVAGGVTCVQLREKHASSREFYDLARDLLAVTRPAGVPLIVNDRLDIALAAGADGVHLGQSDLPLDAARRLVPPDFIIGVSAESTADAVSAAASGATYVAASPVFATPTKTDTAPALGLSGVTALRAALPPSCPLVAIGGIHLSNAPSVLAAGASGLAVVSEIMSAPSPRSAAAALLSVLHAAVPPAAP